VSVRKKAGQLSGRTQDEDGNPLAGVNVQVADLSTTSDSAGHFKIEIPGDQLQSEMDLVASANGYSSSHLTVVPNGNDVVIALARAR
jgi:hypothetical protein